MIRTLLIALLSLTLTACATTGTPSIQTTSELAQGQRFFADGLYKRAIQQLLPLACDGNAQAQYAIGYMYYYGQGVAQDTNVGYFWVKRSADQHYAPAQKALILMKNG